MSWTGIPRSTYSTGLGVIFVFAGCFIVVGGLFLALGNEIRTVNTARGLEEGLAAAETLEVALPESANEGRLVHFTTRAVAADTPADGVFGVEEPGALYLRRTVEMYQWREYRETETKRDFEGNTRRETVYRYRKGWHEGRNDSGRFYRSGRYDNPYPVYASKLFEARDITAGEFDLPTELVDQLSAWQAIDLTDRKLDRPDRFVPYERYILKGEPGAPALGDERVSFDMIAEQEVTVIARQSGRTLEPYKTAHQTEIFLLFDGRRSLAEAFRTERNRIDLAGWAVRIISLAIVYAGLLVVLSVMRNVAGGSALLTWIERTGCSVVSATLAIPVWLAAVCFIWLDYRPLEATVLFVCAMVLSLTTLALVAIMNRAQYGSAT